MNERTFRREDLVESRRRWDEGEFGSEWAPYRRAAANRGFIFPPEGSRWDSWEDDQPSQRAIVYRAIEDTPRALLAAISSSRSWGQVVKALMVDLERRRQDSNDAEQRAASNHTDPDRRQALQALGEISRRAAELVR